MRRLLCVLLLCATPALAQAPSSGQARRVALDRMLDQLKTAQSEAEAASIEARVEHIWIEQGSPAVTLLVSRGLRNLEAGANQEAVDDFDAALTLDPSVAEIYHQRALARFALGDTRGAIRDIEETLKREPRHFAALRTLSRIAASRQDWKGAYAAWLKLLEIDPKTPGGAGKLKDLKRRALGDVT
jgi:tetratricopeptide (TPR) repeat protein